MYMQDISNVNNALSSAISAIKSVEIAIIVSTIDQYANSSFGNASVSGFSSRVQFRTPTSLYAMIGNK